MELKAGDRVSFTCEAVINSIDRAYDGGRVSLSIDGNKIRNTFCYEFACKTFKILPPKPTVGDMVTCGDGSVAYLLVYREGNNAVIRYANDGLMVLSYDELRVVPPEDPCATKIDKKDD